MQKSLDITGFIVYNQCKVINFTVLRKIRRNGGVFMGKNLEISLLLDFYGEMLTEKQRDMVDYYYNDDLSLSEIAENEGITRQGVRDAIKRAEAQMLEMEERLGLARRFRKISRTGDRFYRHLLDRASGPPEHAECGSKSGTGKGAAGVRRKRFPCQRKRIGRARRGRREKKERAGDLRPAESTAFQ